MAALIRTVPLSGSSPEPSSLLYPPHKHHLELLTLSHSARQPNVAPSTATQQAAEPLAAWGPDPQVQGQDPEILSQMAMTMERLGGRRGNEGTAGAWGPASMAPVSGLGNEAIRRPGCWERKTLGYRCHPTRTRLSIKASLCNMTPAASRTALCRSNRKTPGSGWNGAV